MYLGRIVEEAPADVLYRRPLHPYTRALLASTPAPRPGPPAPPAIAGEPASPTAPPPGCPFHPRCPIAEPACRVTEPALLAVAQRHRVACHLVESRDAP
jgi:peptide/nickel transport system ATP-binding protein